ncbi:unnamed protein product, partial [Brenthis ino]
MKSASAEVSASGDRVARSAATSTGSEPLHSRAVVTRVQHPPPTPTSPGGRRRRHARAVGSMAAPLLWLAALALSATPAFLQAIQDSRCYLMNGGAVESFFISEDTPVGSIIGTLSVNGDPNELSGDILLSIQEKNPAVALVAGSKNMTLTRALDREEQIGPSSVYVNVRCDRRHTSDPSFVIPVSVRVWDVNDNAPAWRGAPYRARVSELAAVGARVVAAPAVDPDQAGPHATVHYAVLPGPDSEYVRFASALDSTVVVARPLDYEARRNFTVRLRARDAGRPPRHSDATLTVEVLDADDQNPKFDHDHYTALVPDDVHDGTPLETRPAPVRARDQDAGIDAPVTYAASGAGAALLRVAPATAALAAAAALRAADLPLTLVLKATQVDNPDRYALATLTLQRASAGAGSAGAGAGGAVAGGARAGGAGAVRFARRAYSAAVAETAPPGTVLLALSATAPSGQPLQYYVSERGFLEQFAISGAGDVVLRRALPRDAAAAYRYQVMATDGITNDTASINITVQRVNEWEPRFRHAHYEFLLAPGAAGAGEAVRVGRLHVFDGDPEDNVTLHLSGPDASRLLSVNAAGEVFVRRAALAAAAAELHVVATAVDSGDPPRQTSVPVVVRVASAAARRGAGAPLLAAFTAALALLALLVAALLLYLCRLKRKRQVKDGGSGGGGPGVGGGGGAGAGEKPAALSSTLSTATSASLQSVSAGASSILAASTTSLDRAPHAQHPPAPQHSAAANTAVSVNGNVRSAGAGVTVATGAGVTGATGASVTGATGAAGAGALSDHLQAGAGRSGVAWPSATIPARVKRLSWDDAQPGPGPERRAPAEATNASVADHMNLTVYF